MKARITEVIFLSPAVGKYGKYYTFKIGYDNKQAYFTSKLRQQLDFTAGKVCEFTEEKKKSKKGNPYIVITRIIKPISVTQVH